MEDKFDKAKSCKDCPDMELGCHSKCEGYSQRVLLRQKALKNRMTEYIATEYAIECCAKRKKKVRKKL